ncbi:hypothetical protein [Nocardioides abyssi]|uniref:Uncharacterized protein n=1 Tax=Nocardioides abyssi TaxID=3058370 RepID=A0ABT8ES34_9ACTN|nr:hypothetical protein [Nocardioides abyssi]MDN4160966.1 hypothetical protein [Nocardioides abyssi]
MSPAPTTVVGTRRPPRLPVTSRVSGPTALAALVVALVVGILGMHALASHGTTVAPVAVTGMTAPAHAAEMVASTSHGAHAHAAEPATGTTAVRTEADRGSSSGHDMAAMAMLCVVMLAGAALTLLVLLVVSVRRPLLPASFAPAAVRARVLQWVRGTGPPPVWQFSVIRC